MFVTAVTCLIPTAYATSLGHLNVNRTDPKLRIRQPVRGSMLFVGGFPRHCGSIQVGGIDHDTRSAMIIRLHHLAFVQGQIRLITFLPTIALYWVKPIALESIRRAEKL